MLENRTGGPPAGAHSRHSPRRHARSTVLKAATVYPVLREAAFLIGNVSHFGVMGRCALPLSLSQCVHLTFDNREFTAAEVRWAQGDRYGLQLAERQSGLRSLLEVGGEAQDANEGLRARAPRIPVSLPATLVTTLPLMPGIVRNLSKGGMLIEVGTRIREGERLLVKMRDQPAFIGRVQWSKLGCAGLEFSHELPADVVPEALRAAETPSTTGDTVDKIEIDMED